MPKKITAGVFMSTEAQLFYEETIELVSINKIIRQK